MRGVVPFVDLKIQYQAIKEEILAAVGHVLETGQFVLGDEVSTFEKEFASYVDAKHAIALNVPASASAHVRARAGFDRAAGVCAQRHIASDDRRNQLQKVSLWARSQ